MALAIAAPAAAQVPPAAPVLAITDATVIDGTGAPPRGGQTVIVRDGRIAAIGQGIAVPAGAQVVDGHGRWLLPGFVDANAHLTVYGQPSRRDTSAKYGDRNEELALEVAQRSLKAGVTTLIDSYGVLPPSIVVRDRINRGEAVGSRLLLAGNILGWGGSFSTSFSLTKPGDLSVFEEKWNDLLAQDMGEEIMDLTPDELRVAMDRYLDKGVDVIKYGGTSHFMRPSLIGFSPAQQAVIVAEAHKRHVPVQTHATSPEGLRLAVEAGIDLIQHPELHSRDLPEPLVREIVAHRTLCGMRANLFTGAVRQRHLATRTAAQASIARRAVVMTGAEKWRRFDEIEEMDEIQYRNARRLIAAGCRVVPATDSYLGDAPEFRRSAKGDEGEPGMGTIRAIEGLVELGMTPLQAIVSATRNGGAAALRPDLGTIGRGQLADLVLLDADPLADIRNIERVAAVIAQGRLVDRARLPEHPLFYRAEASR